MSYGHPDSDADAEREPDDDSLERDAIERAEDELLQFLTRHRTGKATGVRVLAVGRCPRDYRILFSAMAVDLARAEGLDMYTRIHGKDRHPVWLWIEAHRDRAPEAETLGELSTLGQRRYPLPMVATCPTCRRDFTAGSADDVAVRCAESLRTLATSTLTLTRVT